MLLVVESADGIQADDLSIHRVEKSEVPGFLSRKTFDERKSRRIPQGAGRCGIRVVAKAPIPAWGRLNKIFNAGIAPP